ncbi:S-layer homology domain-containing protein [Paenibacillus shunpengii]|uniref:S-layer homology domain-containing protein n=1 Tax=Paenibacillus shunpengii TaxID=2054424 RepID=A0ABW5SV56_9BACL
MSKKVRGTVTGLLSISMALSSLGTVGAAQLGKDLEGHWAESQLQTWINQGNLNGYADGTVKPNQSISRAEFVSLINRSFGYSAQAPISFEDLSVSNWAYTDIAKAVEAGYVQGYEDNTFRPGTTVTRQEAAVMIANLLNVKSSDYNTLNQFTDRNSIAGWSKAAVASVVEREVMKGYPNDTFAPLRSLTRAEAIVLIDNAIANEKELNTITYDEAGTYGSDEEKTVIEGNVIISVPDVTLVNTEIKGDLLFAEGIGAGDVTIQNVKVHGTTNVEGGGENSIHFVDSVLLNVVVNKKDGTVRIVAEGSTTASNVIVQSSVKLEEDNVSGNGFTDVELSDVLPAGSKVALNGTFDDVDLYAASISVEFGRGSIENFLVDPNARNNEITVSSNARIAQLVLDAITKLLGSGTISKATVNEGAERSSFQTKPIQIDGSQKDNVILPAIPPATSGGGTSSGGSSGGGSGNSNPPELSADQLAAKNVAVKIEALPEAVTLEDKQAVEDAKQAFSNLTDAQKALVPNLSKTKLEAAIEKIAQLELDNSAASNVESQINELPAVSEVELTNKLEIESARGNYNSLTEAQKELVDEEFVTKLTELEEIIIQLETEAEEVKRQINSLPSPEAIELTQKETVQTVREAYNALDEAQKELVGAESIEKLVAVENAIIALEEAQENKPTITSSLPTEVTASKEYEFEVSTTQGSVPDNTMVWVELELENPEQQGAIQMQYHEIRDGKYYPLPFNQEGLVKYGPASGFPLQDATSKFKVMFSEAGTYEYTVRIVSESGTIVEETYTVEVAEAEVKPTITSTLPTEVTASKEYEFEVSTTKGSVSDNTMVWVELELENPEQQDAIQMQYHEIRDGKYYPLAFNEGRVKYGPEGGFPFQDTSSKLKVSFSKSGTYEYTVRVMSSDRAIVEEKYTIVVVETEPTITSTLPIEVTASKEYEFEVSTTQGSVPDNTMVWVELELENPEQQDAIQMQYHEIQDGKYYPLAFNEGKVKYGPESGFPFQDTASKLKVSFSKSGTYEYTVRVMSSDRAIVEEKYTIVVVETDPTITSTLPIEVLASKEYDFEVSTTKGSEPNNTMVWVELKLENPEQQGAIQMQYHEIQDGTYYPLPFNEDGLVKYGPAGGFPLQDATSKFKVKFSKAGTYEYIVRIVSESGTIVEETYTVEVAEIKPIITSSLPIEVTASKEYDFEVSTTKGSVSDNTMVWVELELANLEQQGAIQMQYHETRDGNYYSLPFNEGKVKYGPEGGFPLQDATSKFKVSFSNSGTYEYIVRIVSGTGVLVQETYLVEVIENETESTETGEASDSQIL